MDLRCPSLVHSLLVSWERLAGLRMVLAGMLSSVPVVSPPVSDLPRVLLMMVVEVQEKSKKCTALLKSSACVKSDNILMAVAEQITRPIPDVRSGEKGSDHLVRTSRTQVKSKQNTRY